MIEISNLTKYLNKKSVISDVSFSAKRQECLGLFGLEGAGKTTLLKMIAGAIQPSSGQVRILGLDTHTHSYHARKAIGYQPESGVSHPTLSVKNLLRFIATVRGFQGAERRRRVDHAASRLELWPVLDYPINTLPPGLKRKVAFAQALLHDPDVLLLDEPSEGLAPHQQGKISRLIQSLADEMTIIVASRDCEALAGVCTRALVIGGGRLLADTPMPELQRSSRHFRAVTLAAESALDLLALAVLPGVAGIEEDRHGPGTVTVLAMPGHSIYPAICALIANRRWEIHSLNLEPGRLNDVVHHLSQEASH
ncbi:ABC transporter ATP-binding protein [Pseudomonas sp. LY-1]|jgi:ABC-2 type transport system ATP-binding protein|uniref:ABC transporter ATP-binding protein n=1 Tax=Pseudomonas veronii TaxID=76761 RepID=A0ABS0VIC8_PSEVE|nr:ABC transporter ATP-binding protein [Pseudomonas veronii]MBI6552160.1 ABC transporter ATP-binding protein [Pseudomonas veronii]MBI6651276.1 ABC transporter ATP-binding protein [Pseudomonas veronii]MCI1736939.1 ABC transporter ATP-binding protein [Pseudomonas veronii]MDF3238271.1 ABC transporter ATP-binding protein [Pseudomonas veronii]